MQYVRRLLFDEDPDYRYMQSLFDHSWWPFEQYPVLRHVCAPGIEHGADDDERYGKSEARTACHVQCASLPLANGLPQSLRTSDAAVCCAATSLSCLRTVSPADLELNVAFQPSSTLLSIETCTTHCADDFADLMPPDQDKVQGVSHHHHHHSVQSCEVSATAPIRLKRKRNLLGDQRL